MLANGLAMTSILSVNYIVTADYTYDGLERMAIRTTQNMAPAGATHYLYDLSGRLLVEADNTGATLREYIWIDDLPLAVVSDVNSGNPNLYYVHGDQLNRPIKMTDASKAVVWDAVYLPFGAVLSITGPAANNLRFPGQYFLIESGLHYSWYRHYDPTLGRYTQPDPLGFVDGPVLYAYARAAPTTEVDPNGLQIVIPRPGMTPVPPGVFDEWRKYADQGMKGLWNFCRRAIGALNGGEDPDCNEEWEAARARCEKELSKPNPNRGITGGYRDVENCARGHVSARCGGNPI